jgi:pimeloyl-ACP methyl ester carboxylesterase
MTVAEMEMTTSRDGTPIAFERSGEGPALILVGGAWNDRHTPAELADRLSAKFTVYRYDRRDRGDSGFTAPYSVDREIEDLVAVMEATGGSERLRALLWGRTGPGGNRRRRSDLQARDLRGSLHH